MLRDLRHVLNLEEGCLCNLRILGLENLNGTSKCINRLGEIHAHCLVINVLFVADLGSGLELIICGCDGCFQFLDLTLQVLGITAFALSITAFNCTILSAASWIFLFQNECCRTTL